MTAALSAFLAVMLLLEPDEAVDVAAAAAISEDANRVETAAHKDMPADIKSARITSRSADLDRKEGVVMFEGDVVVKYSNDCTMCSDRLYVFFTGTNQLSRVVALGRVSITNDARVGTCAMATFRRKRGEIEMFGDGKETLAHLAEGGEDANALEGTRIKFWLDSEQIEVEDSRISSGQKGGMDFL